MAAALKITGMPGTVRSISSLSEAEFDDDMVEVLDLKNIDLGKLKRGQVDLMAGQAAFEYIKLAVELCLEGSKLVS